MISAVGADADGAAIHQAMQHWGMRTDALQRSDRHATGAVEVHLEQGEARYEIRAPRAWDAIADAGHVSTGYLYHGSLALRDAASRQSLEALVGRSSASRFLSICGRRMSMSRRCSVGWGADWLKLNLDELALLLGGSACRLRCAGGAAGFARPLLHRSGPAHRWSPGALLVGDDGACRCSPAPVPARLVDTVGAGDAISAYTLHALLTGQTPEQFLPAACRFAASVCAIRGAISTDRRFYAAFRHDPMDDGARQP